MKIISHRGARGLAPENTILSVKKALEAGADEIEIDLRVTKDNHVVVIHDPFITDNMGQKYLISEYSHAELRAIKPDIPLFTDVVKAVKRRVPLLVEVKPNVTLVPVIAVFQNLLGGGWQPKDFLLGSFSQSTLRELHQAFPEIEPVVIESFSGVHASWRARRVHATRLNMNQRFLWFGFIKLMSKRGYKIYPYTLDDPVKAKMWEKYGLAGVITDRPDLFT